MVSDLTQPDDSFEHFAKPGTMLGDAFFLHMRDNRAALSAPARNCDRFADVIRASEVYEATRTDLPFEEWLFSTEKGKEPDNG